MLRAASIAKLNWCITVYYVVAGENTLSAYNETRTADSAVRSKDGDQSIIRQSLNDRRHGSATTCVGSNGKCHLDRTLRRSFHHIQTAAHRKLQTELQLGRFHRSILIAS